MEFTKEEEKIINQVYEQQFYYQQILKHLQNDVSMIMKQLIQFIEQCSKIQGLPQLIRSCQFQKVLVCFHNKPEIRVQNDTLLDEYRIRFCTNQLNNKQFPNDQLPPPQIYLNDINELFKGISSYQLQKLTNTKEQMLSLLNNEIQIKDEDIQFLKIQIESKLMGILDQYFNCYERIEFSYSCVDNRYKSLEEFIKDIKQTHQIAQQEISAIEKIITDLQKVLKQQISNIRFDKISNHMKSQYALYKQDQQQIISVRNKNQIFTIYIINIEEEEYEQKMKPKMFLDSQNVEKYILIHPQLLKKLSDEITILLIQFIDDKIRKSNYYISVDYIIEFFNYSKNQKETFKFEQKEEQKQEQKLDKITLLYQRVFNKHNIINDPINAFYDQRILYDNLILKVKIKQLTMKEIESNLLPIPKDKPTYDYYIITVNSIVVGLFTNLQTLIIDNNLQLKLNQSNKKKEKVKFDGINLQILKYYLRFIEHFFELQKIKESKQEDQRIKMISGILKKDAKILEELFLGMGL